MKPEELIYNAAECRLRLNLIEKEIQENKKLVFLVTLLSLATILINRK